MQYICLSDLYLGSPRSLLTEGEQNPLLYSLATALRKTVLTMNLDIPPKLLFIGNTLDLTTANRKNALNSFIDFLKALYPEQAPEGFAREIILLPGNYDRKLIDLLQWESLFSDDHNGLLTYLSDQVRSKTHLNNFQVKLASKNMIISNKENQSSIIIEHGYLMDPLYRFASAAQTWYGEEKASHELEKLNGPWIDLLLSLFEREFKGEDIHDLNKLTASPWKLRQTTQRLQRKISVLVENHIPMGKLPEVKDISSKVSAAILEATFSRFIQEREKDSWEILSKRERNNLKWYLTHILKDQIKNNLTPSTFIFGHTQKPFEDFVFTETDDLPWQVYNTGGWQRREETNQQHYGASVVFIDEDLHVGALKLFTLGTNNSISAQTCSGEENPVSKKLIAAIENESQSWDLFSAEMQRFNQ